MKIYLVGGAVRDTLLHLPHHEKDYVVVGATPEWMVEQGFKPVGKDFPVFLHPQTHAEYALARTERKVAHGYHGFEFYADASVTLEEDLLRRDLTINAMAMDEQGHIIDPYGGQQDLQQRILRHVSNAFVEDPVRILRLARFYARFYSHGFKIASETVSLMRQMVNAGEVNALVAERVWQETQKALLEPHPEKFFEALRVCGALAVLFPELEQLFGVPNCPKAHPEIDSGVHTLMVLQQASQLSTLARVRFAALCHDLGKALSPMQQWPKHTEHESKGVGLIQAIGKRFKLPKEFVELAVLAARFHGRVHRILEAQAAEILQLLEETDAFRRPQRFKELLLVAEADFRGRLGYSMSEYAPRPFLESLLDELNQMSIQALLQQGHQGLLLAQAIRQQRFIQIEAILKKRLSNSSC